MKTIIFLSAFFMSAWAVAGPKIKQIDSSNERVAVQATKATTVGSQWMATAKGKQCTLEVEDTLGKLAILDASDCEILADLKVGQRVQKSVFQKNAERVSRTRSKGPKWLKYLKGASVFAAYSLANDVDFKGTNGGSGTQDVDRAIGFGAEYAYNMAEITRGLDFDLVGGLAYELSRDLDNTNASFALWTPYVNANYNFTKSVSALAGLNYSIPQEDGFAEKLKSDIGYQVGMVGTITDEFAVDGIYRWVNMKSKSLKEANLDGFMLRGRYIF